MAYKFKLSVKVSDEEVEKGHLAGNDIAAETVLSETDLDDAKKAAEDLMKVSSSTFGELHDQDRKSVV